MFHDALRPPAYKVAFLDSITNIQYFYRLTNRYDNFTQWPLLSRTNLLSAVVILKAYAPVEGSTSVKDTAQIASPVRRPPSAQERAFLRLAANNNLS